MVGNCQVVKLSNFICLASASEPSILITTSTGCYTCYRATHLQTDGGGLSSEQKAVSGKVKKKMEKSLLDQQPPTTDRPDQHQHDQHQHTTAANCIEMTESPRRTYCSAEFVPLLGPHRARNESQLHINQSRTSNMFWNVHQHSVNINFRLEECLVTFVDRFCCP